MSAPVVLSLLNFNSAPFAPLLVFDNVKTGFDEALLVIVTAGPSIVTAVEAFISTV